MNLPAGNNLPGGGLPELQYDQPARGSSGVIAWIVIILCLAVVVAFNQVSADHRKAEPPQLLAPNVPLEMVSRYTVGFSAFSASTHAQPAVDPTILIVQQLDGAAKTLPDRLRVAIIVGELKGASPALQRINAIGKTDQWPDLAGDLQSLRTIYQTGSDAMPPEARQRLLTRYGWYAHLALGFGQPDSNPDRHLALERARITMVVLLTAGFTIGIAFIAGLVLLIVALVQLADGKIKRAYSPARIDTTPFLEAFAWYLVLYGVLPMLLFHRASGRTSLGLGIYFVAGVLPVAFALSWPVMRGVSISEWRHGLGWHLGTGLFREMCFGIAGYLAGLPILAAGALVTVLLSKISGANTTHPIVNQADGIASAVRLMLLASVFAPLAEESLFRGALFHHLRSRHAWLISALVASVIFAAMHPQGWAAIPTLGAIAMTFAAIREWRGTFVASATAHALNNGVIMILLIVATS